MSIAQKWLFAVLASAATFTPIISGCAGNNGDSAAATPVGGSGSITVTAKDVSCDVERIDVAAGATTTITLENADTVIRTLTVYLADVPVGERVTDTGEVAPGGREEATVLFTSGMHVFRCEIHPERMQSMIVVR